MKYLALIQARCGSTRLPNKVLADLAGQPDVIRVVERVKKSKYIDDVIVVTSINTNNIPLIRLCAERDVRIFVGSEEDVLDRYYQVAKLLKPEYVLRITADCPVIDWRYIDEAIEQLEEHIDYCSDIDETLPDGLDFEIIKLEALQKAWEKANLKSEREHVTLYIKKHPEIFKIQKYRCPIEGISNYRWTLDEDADYELLLKLYHYFDSEGKMDFVTEDILDVYDSYPELKHINDNIMRNEGLKKSLEGDYVVGNKEK